jgi:hypothetical protein
MRRLRPLSEAECYARCYGSGGDDTVRIVQLETIRVRAETSRLSGEQIRALFEGRLDMREEAEAA